MPISPARRPAENSSAVIPNGEIQPIPVMAILICPLLGSPSTTAERTLGTSARRRRGRGDWAGLGIYVGGMPTDQRTFRMGRLDHVHIRVPDRAEAARWYAEHLGFEPVEEYDFWASGFEGGPVQISADGGNTTLALFEVSEGHPMVPQQTGVAFSVDAETFIAFARSLPCGLDNP